MAKEFSFEYCLDTAELIYKDTVLTPFIEKGKTKLGKRGTITKSYKLL